MTSHSMNWGTSTPLLSGDAPEIDAYPMSLERSAGGLGVNHAVSLHWFQNWPYVDSLELFAVFLSLNSTIWFNIHSSGSVLFNSGTLIAVSMSAIRHGYHCCVNVFSGVKLDDTYSATSTSVKVESTDLRPSRSRTCCRPSLSVVFCPLSKQRQSQAENVMWHDTIGTSVSK